MADEYIRKQDASDAVIKHLQLDYEYAWGVREAINGLSAADVVPVVHAYWIPQKENHEFKEVLMNCSACGYPVSRWTGNTNFCPNCGADMRGEQDG